jgi:hypothetical protein
LKNEDRMENPPGLRRVSLRNTLAGSWGISAMPRT